MKSAQNLFKLYRKFSKKKIRKEKKNPRNQNQFKEERKILN